VSDPAAHDPAAQLESAVLDEWHVLCALTDLTPGTERATALLGVPIRLLRGADDAVTVWRQAADPGGARMLPVCLRYGYVWSTLGVPAQELFAIPECAEPDRRLVHAGTFGVRTSAPRAIENFLDMAHFPYVHTGLLGAEPHTEVKDYEVAVSADQRELFARRCRFFQPLSSLAAKDGFEVEYVYRVPHPYCAILYKSCAPDASREDVIAIFARPHDEEYISASLFLAMIDTQSTDLQLRHWQQLIFSQDKPILENQRPLRLPLDPRSEVSVRADRASIGYRRWLRDRGVRYGTIPA
jgi:phenylpropionate dioxygenase-like ring-hydroxylating dioxygenase large terminal subunit